jgi:hypothetical protein
MRLPFGVLVDVETYADAWRLLLMPRLTLTRAEKLLVDAETYDHAWKRLLLTPRLMLPRAEAGE